MSDLVSDQGSSGGNAVRWVAAGLVVLALGLGGYLLATRQAEAVTPTEAGAAPVFVDETASSGVAHSYEGDFTFFVGGGVAAFDCDDDGRSDLYFAGGENQASLYRNTSDVGGSLRFERMVSDTTDLDQVIGAYPIDIDSDRLTDLVVVRLGENIVLRGLGSCRFERANEAWAINGGDQWSAAFSATWEQGSALPTLAFGNYLGWPLPEDLATTCSDNALLRPTSDAIAYEEPVVLSPGWCTLSILFSDWDRSGRRDLRIANDRHYYRDGEEQLWRISPDEAPVLYTRDDGWQLMQIWGMGIASHDVTGDGYPEVFITSQGDNKLQTLEAGAGQPQYGDIAIRRGVTAHRPFLGDDVLPSTAWHPEFRDINNDGFFDLFITKGNVDAMAEYAAVDPNNLLIGQPDGKFLEAAADAGVASTAKSRGAAVADFNLDGMLDLVVVNRTDNVQVWRNVGSGTESKPGEIGNWISIQLSQPGDNVAGVGSWIEVRIGDYLSSDEVAIGGGHAGGQLGWVHFGLGDSDIAEIRVIWPDGEVGPWHQVDANRFLVVDRVAAAPEVWEPQIAEAG